MSTQNAEIIELRAQVAELSERLASLSSLVAGLMALPGPLIATAAAPVAADDIISEQLLITISAAVAAYLGKRVPIRHVRLTGSTSWGQQGRVHIHASHPFAVQRPK